MSNLITSKTKIYGKTISAVILECVTIISSFVLFSPKFNLHSLRGFATILIISYPFLVSICTGFVAGSIAETKGLSGWKWTAGTSALTFFVIITLVSLPSFLSAMAFIIAPLVSLAICFNLMNTTQVNTQA